MCRSLHVSRATHERKQNNKTYPSKAMTSRLIYTHLYDDLARSTRHDVNKINAELNFKKELLP